MIPAIHAGPTNMSSDHECASDPKDIADMAKGALERVCSGAGLDEPSRFYSPAFVDHVNDLEFRGLDGIGKSLEMYAGTLSNMAIVVEDQVVERDRVASRFVVTGTCRGRSVRFNGVTISRFENGAIVEDWSVTDTLGMLRQVGLWRAVLIGLKQWRTLSSH